MEEKIVFPVGDETAQELKDKALSDEELSQVSGGKPCPLPHEFIDLPILDD